MATTAFGETQTAPLSPIIQIGFPYSVPDRLIATTTVESGTVTHSNGHMLCSVTDSNSSAVATTRQVAKYNPGHGTLARFTARFTPGVAGSTQLVGLGDTNDGLFIGYNGADFGILRRANAVDTWSPQSEWNDETLEGTSHNRSLRRTIAPKAIDPTLGNIYQIQYQWLGYGELRFFTEQVETGGFELVHRINYANAHSQTSVLNPTFQFRVEATTTTATNAVSIAVPSIGVFQEGPVDDRGIEFAQDNAKTVTTNASIIGVQNKTTVTAAAVQNRIPVEVSSLSAAVDGTKPAQVRVYRASAVTGASYTNIDATNSCVAYDTNGGAVTGDLIFSAAVGRTASFVHTFDPPVRLSPGETIHATAESDNSTVANVSFAWSERW